MGDYQNYTHREFSVSKFADNHIRINTWVVHNNHVCAGGASYPYTPGSNILFVKKEDQPQVIELINQLLNEL